MRTCSGCLTVIVRRLVFLSELFVGLACHVLNEGIVLVGLAQVRECSFVISRIERDVAFEIRKELCLFGVGTLVEYCFGCSNVSLRFRMVAAPGCDAGLCVF